MLSRLHQIASRRRLLQFLAASPLLAHGAMPAFAQGTTSRPADPLTWAPRDVNKLIENPGQALDVFDFEPVMKASLPPAHFGYMATGVDDEVTLRANREAFQRFQLRPRRLIDVSQIDMRTDILGTMYDSPIVISPTSSNKAFHPEGELAVAKAAKAGNHLQMLSTVATTSIEDAIAARGAPVWFQLYPTQKWEVAEALAKRAERAGSPVIVVTLDVLARQNWETLFRLRRTDDRQCGTCHGRTMQDYVARKPNFDGIDLTGVSFNATNLTWDFVKRLRDTVRTKIVLKGILAYEDAKLAADNGVDGIIVSNHGGRVDDSGRATIDDIAGNRRGGRRADAGAGGQRLPPRHRYRQGPCHGCAGRVHRTAVSVGPRRIRSAWCRTRARNSTRRDARGYAASRCTINQAPHADDGAASV